MSENKKRRFEQSVVVELSEQSDVVEVTESSELLELMISQINIKKKLKLLLNIHELIKSNIN